MHSASHMIDHPSPPPPLSDTSIKSPALCNKPGAGSLLQTQAQQLKHELKTWEAAFAKEHGRIPTKQDLADISDITEKYKRYSKIKRLLGRRSSSSVNEGAISAHKQDAEQAKPLELAMHRSRGGYKPSRMDLPLETSMLRGSIKRKSRHAHSVQNQQRPSASPERMSSSTSCLKDDIANAPVLTPKRQRMALTFDFSNKDTDPMPTLAGELTTNTSEPPPAAAAAAEGPSSGDVFATQSPENNTDDADFDMVAYTPAPSLIRRYGVHKRSTTAQSLAAETSSMDPLPTYSPLLPSLSAMSVCDDSSDSAETNATRSSINVPSLGISMPLLKSRPGKLVKTTSIPLSTFGAQLRVASRSLALQKYEGDFQETDQLDPEELVMDDPKDFSSLPGEEDDLQGNVPKKKTTQKRSTRRVKIKPLDDKEDTSNPPKPSLRSNSQNLVSSNFYKLKLKGRKRGNGSSEERRTALYKRMVGKQNKPSSAPNAVESVHGYTEELASKANACGYEQNEVDFSTDMYLPNDLPEPESACTDNQNRQEHAACAIAGEPLYSFYVNDGSDAAESCLVSPSFSNGADYAFKDKRIDLCRVLRRVWGFNEFRKNQADTIKQILGNRSTLLVLATGSGKSLVYQLPALVLSTLFGGLTLVVTPLISLMRDQIQSLPSCFQAVCMSSEASFGDSYSDAKIRLMTGKVQLLFVSPERMQSPRFHELMATEGMPSIHFAVIDEAHCASEWSHNFRPAYLQLPQMLHQVGVGCVLAMTGTATYAMARRLCSMFGISADGGVVRGSAVRDNIELNVVRIEMDARAVSRTNVREESLVSILRSTDMAKLGSVLVYVSTQANADRVAEYLTARSIPAQAYHAGKPASERARIQKAFMGKGQGAAKGSSVSIRVLVATVAFGMGLDKSDIRAVIHFNLPRSMEAYVQEVGRAGRDGSPACGVLLLTTDTRKSTASTGIEAAPQSVDAVSIRSWAHADGVDIASIRRLLHQIFPPEFVQQAVAAAADAYSKSLCPQSDGWRVSKTMVLELRALERDVDSDHIVIQTLINYLALREPAMVQIEPNTHRRCRIRPVRTNLAKLADSHVFFKGLVDCVYSCGDSGGGGGARARSARKRQTSTFTRVPGTRKTEETLVVDIFELAAHLCITSSEVTAELYKWRAKKELVLEWQEPSIVVNVALDMSKFAPELVGAGRDDGESTRSMVADKDVVCEQLAQLVDKHITDLVEHVGRQHGARIRDNISHVNTIESTMLEAAQLEPNLQNKLIQASVQSYFSASGGSSAQPGSVDMVGADVGATPAQVGDNVRQHICKFIEQHLDRLRSGRAVARVMHGLSSPSSPASQWSWCAEWASLVWTDFEAVRLCAQEELVKMRFAGINS